MTSKKWIILGIILVASALLVATVVAGPVAQSSEAGPDAAGLAEPALSANRGFVAEGPGGSLTVAAASPVGTGFTYQGELKDGGEPVSGDCQMAFRLYDQAAGGSQVGSAITTTVPISDGRFTVTLDFGGGVFAGDARWLGIKVQCPGDAGFTTLSSRQALTPAPYAIYALKAPWSGLMGVPAGFADGVDNNTTYSAGTGLSLAGTQFSLGTTYRLPQSCGNGQIAEWNGSAWACGDDDAGATGSFWSLSGNGGTTPGTHFLGTTDGVSLTLAVSGTAALRLEPNGTSPNLIGGYSGNSVAPGVVGATIGGGGSSGYINQVTGDHATIGGGWNNYIGYDSEYATVSGGADNIIGDSSFRATIAGGRGNDIGESSHDAIVGGGWNNDIGDDSSRSIIGGGYFNDIGGESDYSIIDGGYYNEIWDSVDYSTIGGGRSNIISDTITNWATIGGGYLNTASLYGTTVGGGRDNSAISNYATVGGGRDNVAYHEYATVPGGRYNQVQGQYGFAAGYRAKAWHPGAFVWADSSNFDFESTASNQFSARATGGARFVLGIGGTGNPTWTCSVVSGGSWSCSSDRNLKENLILAGGSDVLERLSQVPVYYWNAKGQATQHIGPTAQDFYAAFGVGDSDTAIATIDLDGVALAAIQGLYAQNQALQQQNADLEARVAALEGGPADGSAPSQGSQTNLLPWASIVLAGLALAWASRRRDVLGAFSGGRR